MKNNHRSGPLDISALHLLHRAGQCAEVLFTNETAKTELTPRQYAILASVAQNPDISQTGLVEQTGRGPLDAGRHRTPAGEEGPAAAQAHPPRRPHVCRAPDRQGAIRPRLASSRWRPRSTSASCPCCGADQRSDFIECAGRDREGHDRQQRGCAGVELPSPISPEACGPCITSGKARSTMARVSAQSSPARRSGAGGRTAAWR